MAQNPYHASQCLFHGVDVIGSQPTSDMSRSMFAAGLFVLFLTVASIPTRADGFISSELPKSAPINTQFSESHTQGFDTGEFGVHTVTSSFTNEQGCDGCSLREGLFLDRIDLDSDSDSRKPRKHEDRGPIVAPEQASLTLLGTVFLGMAWIRRSRNSSLRCGQQL